MFAQLQPMRQRRRLVLVQSVAAGALDRSADSRSPPMKELRVRSCVQTQVSEPSAYRSVGPRLFSYRQVPPEPPRMQSIAFVTASPLLISKRGWYERIFWLLIGYIAKQLCCIQHGIIVERDGVVISARRGHTCGHPPLGYCAANRYRTPRRNEARYLSPSCCGRFA